MALKGKAEYVIEDAAGCGQFQVLLYVFALGSSKLVSSFATILMSFGNYNPGWRCLDNTTSVNSNNTKDDLSNLEYTVGSCDEYEQCRSVEFDPETSTVVTEWGLLCDKEWIPSLIISLQMVGMLIGSFAGGHLSDFFGRKKIFYGSIGVCAVLNLASSFSVSWIMFNVIRFFLGVFVTCLQVTAIIKISEFTTIKWRAVLVVVPFWTVGACIQALLAMGLKDWRNLELAGLAICVILMIPIFWVPESLRWLEVNGKTEEFEKVAKKIARCNGKTLPSLEGLEICEHNDETSKNKKYTIFDLFRPGYKCQTVIIAFVLCSFSLIFYALTFGVKSMFGDFYINTIIFNVIPLSLSLAGLIPIRVGSRTAATLGFLILAIVCLIAAFACIFSGSENAKTIGSTVLISISKGAVGSTWTLLYARVTEMYPTVVRCTALGFASLAARTGAILSPFVLPRDSSRLHIFVATSAALLLVCCCLMYKLPETKGKKLKETFDD